MEGQQLKQLENVLHRPEEVIIRMIDMVSIEHNRCERVDKN